MRVKVGIRRLNDPAALQLTSNIIAGATGKAELAASPVTLAQLTTLTADGQAALDEEAQAEDALAMKRTERAEKFEELRQQVMRYAEYADTIYGGNRSQLQAIGLDVRIPAPVGLLPAPQNLRSRAGNMEGTADLRWNTVAKRDFYVAECASNASGPWTQVYHGRPTHAVCGGLTPGAEYFFRVRAHSAAGPGPWSDITKTRAA